MFELFSVSPTEDSSASVSGFGANNLLTNLEHRSGGNDMIAIKTAAVLDGVDETYIED